MIRLLAPRLWGGHVAMVLAVAAAGALGLWQLHAWQDRRAAAAVDLTNAAPVTLASVLGGDSPFPGQDVGRPVTFSGRWLSGGTVYVSDRRLGARTGYWVVSPLLVDGTRSAMPVVRGWTSAPKAPPVSGTTAVAGWLQPGEGTGAVDANPADDVLPELRIASLVQHVGTDLYGGYVIAKGFDGSAPGSVASPAAGLAALHPDNAPPVATTTALRNFLYAIEWWVFGLFALVVWVRWCRDVVAGEQQVPSTA